ncbi:MAG TPA: glycosyltransferase family 4 protein [Vicinamibacterales bacterium]|nr:glycosyltransferase family 4 protein [Vicinamibacterales bacterium]
MTAWLIASGDFTQYGGMDAANYALASYLARTPPGGGGAGNEVHLVAHRVAAELAAQPAVHVHHVTRPLGMHRLGEPLLRRATVRAQQQLTPRRVRVVANGGNVDAGDINWVHYVHAAFTPEAAGTLNLWRVSSNHRRYLVDERRALERARMVICNSERTADDVTSIGVPRDRTRVVYYGIDAARFAPVDAAERRSSRRALGLPEDRCLALFIGALGDRRKGFDTLYGAWRELCARPAWDVDLVVAGTGAELSAWQRRTAGDFAKGRVRFLGFRRDIPAVLAACDLLVHPARYEAYGLAVHEALCRGLPAIVSASAGIAERYPADLAALLLHDPASACEIVERLLSWRADDQINTRVAAFASRLRARSWDHMARDIVACAEALA